METGNKKKLNTYDLVNRFISLPRQYKDSDYVIDAENEQNRLTNILAHMSDMGCFLSSVKQYKRRRTAR